MTEIRIRPATPDDAPMMSAMIQRAIRETNAGDYSAEIIALTCLNFAPDRVVEKMAVRDVFVGTVEAVIVGTVSLGGSKLHSLFVEPHWQRQGFGAALLFHLEVHAVAKGLRVLYLSSSITARPFYARMGYSVITIEERHDGSTILMSKTLA